MYLKSKMRLLGMSALVGAGLVAATSASAYNVRLGGVDIVVDTITSAGVTVRTTDIEDFNLSEGNGGNVSTVQERTFMGAVSDCGSVAEPGTTAHVYGGMCGSTGTPYARSVNGDDGRLNFGESGDLMSGTVKFTSDISADLSNSIRAFARVRGFYDAVLGDDGSYARGEGTADKGEGVAVAHLDLLDAYVSADLELAGNPVQVRLGKQVINWGEATFILGGNSVFSPIDIPSIRKPGAEIKDALLPVEALYASMALPYDLTLEAYVGGSDKFTLDVGGTAFAGSDVAQRGNGFTANDVTMIGGGEYAGMRAPCSYNNEFQAFAMPDVHAITAAIQGAVDCDVVADIFDRDYTEDKRSANPYDYSGMARADDQDNDGDTMGVAVRWYSEALNSTEFGFYYQKYQSRLPYVTVVSNGPELGIVTQGAFSGGTGRGTFPASHARDDANDNSVANCGANLGANIAAYDGVTVRDPNGLASVARSISNSIEGNSSQKNYLNADGEDVTLAEAIQIACIGIHGATTGVYVDSGDASNSDANTTGAFLTGHSYLSPVYGGLELKLTYPEDIEVMGMSFNTTAFGWGIQGDFAYREEMPLQIDTDSLTAAGLVTACYFTMGGGSEAVFVGRSTQRLRDAGSAQCQQNRYEHLNTIEEEVFNWDIGTTATFTRSNPVVSFLGADIGILLTEFAGVYAEDIEDESEYGSYLEMNKSSTPTERALLTATGVPLASKCTGGSDLPLGSLFALDPREFGECRPTASSWGAVALGRLVYNNFMGTPFNISPTIVYRAGIDGYSPTPAGSWVQDAGSASFSVGVDYQEWAGSLSYTNNFGPQQYTKNKDMDYMSVSVSRAF
jgi:hypothetical protein